MGKAAAVAVNASPRLLEAAADFCAVLWMFGDVVAQVFGAVCKIALVAIGTVAALHKGATETGFVKRRDGMLRRTVLIHLMHKVALINKNFI